MDLCDYYYQRDTHYTPVSNASVKWLTNILKSFFSTILEIEYKKRLAFING